MKPDTNLSRIETADLTLFRLLKENAVKYGTKKAALRVKRRGIWQETSWQNYYEITSHLALGLKAAGVMERETVAIICHNMPAVLYAIIAASTCGCTPICIHYDSTANEIGRLINRFDIRHVIAENQEQVDKLLENQDFAGGLRRIIYCNQRGMRGYSDDRLHSLESIIGIGQELSVKDPQAFEDLANRGSSDDIAMICTTSGVSGEPKGALLTHRNLLTSAAALADATAMNVNHETMSFLPFSWSGELTVSLATALVAGFTVNFPESIETVMPDLREIGPHLLFATPEVWSSIASSVQGRMAESSPFKRFMYRNFITAGENIADLRLAGSEPGVYAKLRYRLAHILLIRALRDRLGLSRVKIALTGGSPLGKDAFRFFHSIGITLKQVYGLTELAGIVAVQSDSSIRVESSGHLLKGIEAMVSTEGELLLKGHGLFREYCRDTENSVTAFANGWFRTGDSAMIGSDGQLIVADRLDSIITLDSGRSIAPQSIESRFNFSPYIRETVVVGRGKKFLSALVCIDGRVVGKWAGDSKLSYSTYCDLAAKPQVYGLISSELERINRDLPEESRIKRFTILYKDLDPDDSETSRSGKIRRNILENRFSDLIAALYDGSDFLEIDKTIELADGKSARLQSRVLIKDLV